MYVVVSDLCLVRVCCCVRSVSGVCMLLCQICVWCLYVVVLDLFLVCVCCCVRSGKIICPSESGPDKRVHKSLPGKLREIVATAYVWLGFLITN